MDWSDLDADCLRHSKRYCRGSSLGLIRIPRRVSEKSYRTGSSGAIVLNAQVISRTVFISACLRVVSRRAHPIRYRWVSRGARSLAGGTPSHPPGSTASLRTIQRKNRFIRLHALPVSGEGRRVLHLPVPGSESSRIKDKSAGSTVSCSFRSPDRKHALRDPYRSMAVLAPYSRAARSSPVVKRCLKSAYSAWSDARDASMRKWKGRGIRRSTVDTLFNICATLPYAREDATSPTISRSRRSG